MLPTRPPLAATRRPLLQVLAGLDDFDQGSISRNKGARVGFLAQEPALPPGTTVLQVGAPGATLRPRSLVP